MTAPLIAVEMKRKGREGVRRRKIQEKKGKRAALAAVHLVTLQASQAVTRPVSQVENVKEIKRNLRSQRQNTAQKSVGNHQPLENLKSLLK